MKECLECGSTSIRFEKNIRAFICENCGFMITRDEYYKLRDDEKNSRKGKEENSKELYKWLISKKE